MNISYNWLKEYVDFDLTPEEVASMFLMISFILLFLLIFSDVLNTAQVAEDHLFSQRE